MKAASLLRPLASSGSRGSSLHTSPALAQQAAPAQVWLFRKDNTKKIQKTPHLPLHSKLLLFRFVSLVKTLFSFWSLFQAGNAAFSKYLGSLSCLRERLFSNTFKCAGQLLWIGAEGDAEDCPKDH